EQLAAAKIPILHLPTVLGAVVPTFNLPGIERLRFTPEALAGIFLGKVTKWDDPAIAEANPGVKLPAIALVPMHRSDGSGTTYIFTDYLSKVSPERQRSVRRGTSVNWPVGLGGTGDEGVAGLRAAIKKFLEWLLSDGQSFAAPLNYAPLPPAVVTRERQALSKIAVGGS